MALADWTQRSSSTVFQCTVPNWQYPLGICSFRTYFWLIGQPFLLNAVKYTGRMHTCFLRSSCILSITSS